MTTDLIFGVVLLILAIAETVTAKIILPRVYAKSPTTDEQQLKGRAFVLKAINGVSYAAFAGGLAVLFFKPFGR